MLNAPINALAGTVLEMRGRTIKSEGKFKFADLFVDAKAHVRDH